MGGNCNSDFTCIQIVYIPKINICTYTNYLSHSNSFCKWICLQLHNNTSTLTKDFHLKFIGFMCKNKSETYSFTVMNLFCHMFISSHNFSLHVLHVFILLLTCGMSPYDSCTCSIILVSCTDSLSGL